uniref:Candidate secreted effector n=1 Tax=Meloidogyne incognita TaxID=6306 RepID=A0A914M8R7_MELIC
MTIQSKKYMIAWLSISSCRTRGSWWTRRSGFARLSRSSGISCRARCSRRARRSWRSRITTNPTICIFSSCSSSS